MAFRAESEPAPAYTPRQALAILQSEAEAFITIAGLPEEESGPLRDAISLAERVLNGVTDPAEGG